MMTMMMIRAYCAFYASISNNNCIYYNKIILLNNFEHSRIIILLKPAGKGYSRMQILMVLSNKERQLILFFTIGW